MPRPQNNPTGEPVVELVNFRTNSRKKTVNAGLFNAELLSLRQHLVYQASVEIDELQQWFDCYGQSVGKRMVKQVRTLLDQEFGSLRVHRYRNLYVVRHRSVEALISGLLRIQFHAHQIQMPQWSAAGEAVNPKAVTLTWGVGRTTTEAEVERLKRRRQKFRR